jgi:class 3 adenylate cyclase/pimeloyl-ACP methyl ester carboxylesterase
MEREVRFCTTEDGVRIAYSVEGDGPPLLICPFFNESFALEHLVPEHQHFMRRLGEGRTLIRFDWSGTGLSQRDPPSYTIDNGANEVEAVIRAAKVRHVSIWSPSNMRNVAVFTVKHPQLARRLIIYGSANLDPHAGFPPDVLAAFTQLAQGNWDMASHMFADLYARSEFPEVAARIGEWYRQSTTGKEMSRLFGDRSGVDVRSLLSKIQCPTLILHRVDDPLYSFDYARSLASLIPDARLVPLQGSVWAFFLQDSQSILDAVNSFLDEDPETRARYVQRRHAEPGLATLRTVLFTDLVGHTEMMSRLGDERGRAVLREHERITREVLKANGGTEVKTMGDGFMASFGSVTRAVQCAVALQRAFADREGEPLNVRVGLNAGEPIEEDGDLFGATVILASRLAAKADGGEILVADTVRGLCSGKGFLFADRGEFVAKGFEEPVRVYEVSWSFDSRSAEAPRGSG